MSATLTPFPGSELLGRGFKLIDTRPGQTDFRYTCQKLLLTYKTQLDKEKYCHVVLSKHSCRGAQLWVVHEGSYSHVLISFGGKQRFETRNESFFDYGFDTETNVPLRPVIHTIDGRNPKAWSKAIAFMMRQEDIKPAFDRFDLDQLGPIGSRQLQCFPPSKMELGGSWILFHPGDVEKVIESIKMATKDASNNGVVISKCDIGALFQSLHHGVFTQGDQKS